MGKSTGFLEYQRKTPKHRPVPERVHDWTEVYEPFPLPLVEQQGARCMDCGIPFCHQGCPLENMIPDWNDMAYRGRWREAIDRLHATNNFPEFTGRLCPAPCEASCVLGINADPVTIKLIEFTIIERAWEEGWVKPEPPVKLTGKKVAIIGSGPAGLASAQQLCRAGHEVTVFERADRIGGLLRYGIPHFKLEKGFLDRRLAQMEAEGVVFRPGVNVGVDIDAHELRRQFDALVLAGGATQARDLPIPGRHLKGIYQAMHFLPMANRYAIGDVIHQNGDALVRPTPPYSSLNEVVPYITTWGKKVIIIGGGDTGADCLGTVHRQGCASVVQFEIVPRPPDRRAPDNPWPQWSNIFRVSGAHEEGGLREYQINTREFLGDEDGNVCALRTTRVNMEFQNGRMVFIDVPGTEQIWDADLVLLAMGFLGPEKGGMLEQLGVEFTPQGNVKADENKMTSVPGVFTAGDMTRGQSLVVWAIAEGRQAAAGVDQYLMGDTDLPRPLDHGNDRRPFV
ncbi:MAG: glutamate synthase subunit beta [Armatimonadetes bacterium]|nr:glutamate synthase subunit beta [Armatimonadota bacterium]